MLSAAELLLTLAKHGTIDAASTGASVLPQLGRRAEKWDPSPAGWGMPMKDAPRGSAMHITTKGAHSSVATAILGARP